MLPGSSVRILVGGIEQPPNAQIRATGLGPVVVTLAFPFDVDRGSVERWLGNDPYRWRDGRTLDITLSVESSSAGFKSIGAEKGFKIAETLSADGRYAIDWFIFSVIFPPSRVANIYTVADLTSGVRPVPSVARRVGAPFAGGYALSPDASTLLTFDTNGMKPSGLPPSLVDVVSATVRGLAVPMSAGPFAYAGWLADGRLLLVGNEAWTLNGRGEGAQRIADVRRNGFAPTLAVPSANGIVALGYMDGTLALLDLHDATVRSFGSLPATSVAWSKDAKLLAAVVCDMCGGPDGARVTVIDVTSGASVRVIPGGGSRVSALPTGDLMLVGPSEYIGEGAPSLGRIVGFDGAERSRYLGGQWSMSPDGRYLLQMEPVGGAGSAEGTTYTLIDLRSGVRTPTMFLPWTLVWLPDGRLASY